MELFFDVETSGFINKKLSASDPGQTWIMQIAFILSDENRIYTEFSSLIKAAGRNCHPGAQAVHGISIGECDSGGMMETEAIGPFYDSLIKTDILVAHNIFFDREFVRQLMMRVGLEDIPKIPLFCTMKSTTDLCKLPGRFGKYKWPKLTELHKFLFNEDFEGAHDALADVRATRRCYYKLKEVL